MPNVFISYRRDDKASSREIYKRLLREGYNVWLDTSYQEEAIREAMIEREDQRAFSYYESFPSLSLNQISSLSNLVELNLSDRTIDDNCELGNLTKLEVLQLQRCVLKDSGTNRLSRFIDFSFLKNIENLKTLNVQGCYWKSSHSVLSRLHKLNVLSVNLLCKKQDGDQTPMKYGSEPINATNLTEHDDNQNSETRFYMFKETGELINHTEMVRRTLNLYYDPDGYEEVGLSNTDFLQNLKELTSLTLYNCYLIQDLSLSFLKKLESLTLVSCSGIMNLLWLNGLDHLRELTLIGTSNLRDITTLQELKALKRIIISHGARINDFSVLENMPITKIAIPHDIRQKLSAKQIRYFSKINKLSEQQSTALVIELGDMPKSSKHRTSHIM